MDQPPRRPAPPPKTKPFLARATGAVERHSTAALALIAVLAVLVVVLYAKSRGLLAGAPRLPGRAPPAEEEPDGPDDIDGLIDEINSFGA